MGSPSGRVPEQGPNWLLVATEACGGGTPDLSSVLEVLQYVGIYGCKGYVGGATGAPRGRGRTQGERARPHPREHLPYLLTWGRVHQVGFLPKITSPVDFVPF